MTDPAAKSLSDFPISPCKILKGFSAGPGLTGAMGRWQWLVARMWQHIGLSFPAFPFCICRDPSEEELPAPGVPGGSLCPWDLCPWALSAMGSLCSWALSARGQCARGLSLPMGTLCPWALSARGLSLPVGTVPVPRCPPGALPQFPGSLPEPGALLLPSALPSASH